MVKIVSHFQPKHWLYSAITFVSILLISIILWPNKQFEISVRFEKTNNVDSIVLMLEKLPSGSFESVGINKLELLYDISRADYSRLMYYLSKRIQSENTPYGQSCLMIGYGLASLKRGDQDSVLYYLLESEKLMQKDNNRCDYYYLYSKYYYSKRDINNAKEVMIRGLEESIRFSDLNKRLEFLNNLGTICYSDNLNESAFRYFYEEYENYPKNKAVPALLINQLVTIKILAGDFQFAENLLKKNVEVLESVNDPFIKQFVILNKIGINISYERWDQSAALLSGLNDSLVVKDLRLNYLSQKLSQMKQVEPDGLKVFIIDHLAWIGNEYNEAVVVLLPYLLEVVKDDPDAIPLDSLSSWKMYFIEHGDANPQFLSSHYELVSAIYKRAGESEKALNALQIALDLKGKSDLQLDSIRQADMASKKEFDNINIRQLAYESELNNLKKMDTLMIVLYVAGVIIVVLLFFTFWIQRENRKKEKEKLKLENEIQHEEQEFIQKEKELTARLSNMSDLVVEKSVELSKKIKDLNKSNKPELDAIRKEMEALGRMDTDLRAADFDPAHLKRSHILKNFPQVNAMNLTEKQVFLLSVAGHKTKEIALIIGVTPQYIHNVRSKIRKVLGIDNSVSWGSFKENNQE